MIGVNILENFFSIMNGKTFYGLVIENDFYKQELNKKGYSNNKIIEVLKGYRGIYFPSYYLQKLQTVTSEVPDVIFEAILFQWQRNLLHEAVYSYVNNFEKSEEEILKLIREIY